MTSTPRPPTTFRHLLVPIAAAALLAAPMSGCHGHSRCGGSEAAGFALLAGVVALAVFASDCDDGHHHHHEHGYHSHGHWGYDRCR